MNIFYFKKCFLIYVSKKFFLDFFSYNYFRFYNIVINRIRY